MKNFAVLVLAAILAVVLAEYQITRDPNNPKAAIYWLDYNIGNTNVVDITDSIFRIFRDFEDEPNRTMELLQAVNIDLDGYCPTADRWNMFAVSTCETFFRFGKPATKYVSFRFETDDGLDTRGYVLYNECN